MRFRAVPGDVWSPPVGHRLFRKVVYTVLSAFRSRLCSASRPEAGLFAFACCSNHRKESLCCLEAQTILSHTPMRLSHWESPPWTLDFVHTYTAACIHMYSHVFTCIHMYSHVYCIHMYSRVYTGIHMHRPYFFQIIFAGRFGSLIQTDSSLCCEKRKLSSCCIHLKIFDLALCGRTKDRIFWTQR